MKSRIWIVGLMVLASLMLACNVSDIFSTPTTQVVPGDSGGDVWIDAGLANVESIEILIAESFPVQIYVLASGNFPDACTSIDQVEQQRSGNTFNVTLRAARLADQACATVLTPFEETVSLEVYGLPAGVYTVDVNGVQGTFELTTDNTLDGVDDIGDGDDGGDTVTLGGIRGMVWHDLCAVPWSGMPDAPPAGCVELPSGGYQADGTRTSDEPGLGGVEVQLGAGACPATGLATAVTDVDGSYAFSGLEDGTYCVSIDALSTVNAGILIPGSWTYPDTEALAEITVAISGGSQETGVDFGWDFQFLPEPE